MQGRAVSGRAESGGRRSDWVANRNAILEGARELLSLQPDASMAQLAEAGGVHRGTLYRHFERREDLLLAIGVAHLEELTDVATSWPTTSPRDDADLAAMADQLIEVSFRWKVARYLPVYPVGSEQEFSTLRAACAEMLGRGQQRPGLLRGDMTSEDLARAWLTPLAFASDPTTDPATTRRFMLAAVRPAAP